MFRSIEEVERYCKTTPEAKALLNSSARPIVLLKHRELLFAEETNKTSRYTGCFLPSMGLHYLLLNGVR